MASLVVSVMSRCAPYFPRPDAAWERTCGVGRVIGRKQYLRLHLATMNGLLPQDKPQRSSKRRADGRGPALIVEILRMLRTDLRKLAQRTRQMGAQMLLRFLRFAAGNRFRDQLVVTDDILRLAG